MQEKTALTGILKILEEETGGPRVYFGEIVEALNHRGFGALLMAPALLTILPTGAIPGVPALNGIFICLIAGQILAGRSRPWLPSRLEKISMGRKNLLAAARRAKPYTRKVDRYVRPRLKILSRKGVYPLVAAICCLLAIMMIIIGFIPFLPAVISIPILFFALGISARDGAMIICGFVFTFASVFLVLWLAGVMNGEDRLNIGRPVFTKQASFTVDLDAFGLSKN